MKEDELTNNNSVQIKGIKVKFFDSQEFVQNALTNGGFLNESYPGEYRDFSSDEGFVNTAYRDLVFINGDVISINDFEEKTDRITGLEIRNKQQIVLKEAEKGTSIELHISATEANQIAVQISSYNGLPYTVLLHDKRVSTDERNKAIKDVLERMKTEGIIINCNDFMEQRKDKTVKTEQYKKKIDELQDRTKKLQGLLQRAITFADDVRKSPFGRFFFKKQLQTFDDSHKDYRV